MLSLTKVQELAAHKPRTWRRATIDQRNKVADTYEKTGDLNKAFKAIKFSRVTDADLFFVPSRKGSQYSGGRG